MAAFVPAGNANHAVAKTAPTIHDVELVIRNKPSLATVHYRITAALGAGGMGEVYLAEDTKLDRKEPFEL